MRQTDLKTKLANLPDEPGVYIMYDADGNILYVGKAKNLKNRVRQYFFATEKTEKVAAMVSHVDTFRYIITASETDALSLENTLIKKHKPPYNILLKDDKQYPYVKVDLAADFPKFVATRKFVRDNWRYFGPITYGGVKSVCDILSLAFPTVSCNHNFQKLPKNFRPCLNYHIGRCPAPCIDAISKADYRKIVNDAVAFLSGEDEQVKSILQQKMREESEKTNYEQALVYKRYLEVIDRMNQRRVAVMPKNVHFDVFAIVSDGRNAVVNHTMVRGGKVVFSDNFPAGDAGMDEGQTLSSFLLQYAEHADLSQELYVNVELSDVEQVAAVLKTIVQRNVTVACAKRGDKKKLTDMSARNALEYLTKSQTDIEKEYNSTVGAVSQLKELLHLKALPKRMECYDISNISGVDKVSSMVVFENGRKNASAYRHFRIETVEGANDFASMKETLVRRLTRLKEGDERFGARPDLIVIDGGLGQLDYARQAMEETGVFTEMVSLAKREELVYTLRDDQPVFLPRNSYALHLLINIRDESHRFAITYFRKLHGKNALKSVLSEIEGIGEKRQIALHRHFRTLDRLKSATAEEIAAVETMTRSSAQKVYDFFHK